MKVGRNYECPCGSGKKYKKCHLINPLSPSKNAGESFQKYLVEKNEKLFELNGALRSLVEGIMTKSALLDDPKHVFSAFAIAKAYKTHGAVLDLCQKGYGEDAAVLVRTIFDLYVTLAYILNDKTNHRIERYLSYDYVLRKKTFDYAKTNPNLLKLMEERELRPRINDLKLEEVLKKADEVQKKYSYKNSGWSDKSIRDMAEEIGRLDAYSTAYKLQSQLVHSATRVMNDYLKADGRKYFVEIGPTENWVSENLVASFDFLMHIALEYDNLHVLGYKEKIEELAKQWVNEVDKKNKN